MYEITLSTGEVVRVSDGKVVAPCQSPDDADFLAYLYWVQVEGNQPVVIDLPTE
jgi:hypothetical protein